MILSISGCKYYKNERLCFNVGGLKITDCVLFPDTDFILYCVVVVVVYR